MMFEKKNYKVLSSINVCGNETTEISKFVTEEEAIRKVTHDAVNFESLFTEETENEKETKTVESLLNMRECRMKRVIDNDGFYAVIFTRIVK